MNITAKPIRLFQLTATIAALALPAIVASPIASAKDVHTHGVRAQLTADGTLEVSGHGQANAIALRLQLNNPSVVQVDAGDDGSADFSFARSQIAAIDVNGGGGDDSIRIDDANGAFTNTIPTTLEGNRGDDSLTGGLGAETFKGDGGDDVVVGARATTSPSSTAGTTRSSGTTATAATRSRAMAATTPWSSTAPPWRRTSRSAPTARG
jgi:hypothetical protein